MRPDRAAPTALRAGPRLGPVLLLCLLAVATSVPLLESWLGGFDQVRSSTGAWILAHLHWVRFVGDYRAAAAVSLVPNTTYDPLYPAIVSALAGPGTDLVVLAHRVAAAGVGLTAVALACFWSRLGGPALGLAGAAAVLFPPFLATGGLVRYDTLAAALTVFALVAAARARAGLHGAWFLAGLLAGLAYLAREFTLGPTLAGIGVAWLAAAWRVRRLEAVLGSLLGVALGLAVGAVPLTLALGLSPLGGLDALLGYGGRVQGGPARSLADLLYLDVFPRPLLLGAVGWLIALARARDRGAVLIGLSALGAFAVFLLSSQQSPQYYLIGHLLLLSGCAGFGLLLRWWPVQLVLAAWLFAVGGKWAVEMTPRLMQADRDRHPRVHTEGWPARADEPAALIDRALDWVGERPLLVSSGRMENLDALVPLRHGRPAAFVFNNWQDRVGEIVSLYDGVAVYYLSVEGRTDGHALPDGAVVVDQWEGPELSAVLALLPPHDAPRGVDLCQNGGPVRGACMQRAWLAGGDEGLRTWIRAEAERFDQRLTASTRWW